MMRELSGDTPPTSVNGDEITADDDGVYFEEVEEFQFDDEEMVDDQEEEDTQMSFPEDNAIGWFNKHNGSVFCCDFHPTGKIGVTGGEDDKAFVFDVKTLHVIWECTGHKDSVIFVGFSFDGAYLATADMRGIIKVWKVVSLEDKGHDEPWPLVFEYEADDLCWGLWHFGARVLICGTVTGDIYVFKIPSGETKVLQGHNVRTECGKMFNDGVRLASGYEDGAVKVWDLKTAAVLTQVPAGVHQTKVTAIDTHSENNLMLSISTDGKAVMTTASNGKVVAQMEAENDLETVAFAPDPQLGYFALGTLNGSVTIWDTSRQMLRHHCAKSQESDGVTKMLWIKDQLVTGCLDGSVRVYDARSGNKRLTLSGHISEILDFAYNDNDKLIMTTSDDGTMRMFKYEESE